ncbi:FliI/YscN family ATPase [Henriciella sp.]|uniref:FliI/YscN family ATPase n=1 Tax=Henriciella sp. TaxID=1968823 RepID=UPI00262922CB|nr:FliI/YscN family ATPase [Henriciella sp.]
MLQTVQKRPHQLFRLWGTVTDVAPGMIKIAGISQVAGIGNEITLTTPDGPVHGEILSVNDERATALLFRDSDAVRIGDKVEVEREARVTPGDHWLGQIVNYRGEIVAENPALAPPGLKSRRLHAAPPSAHARKGLGERMSTGWMITDTILPICRGQRLGLFAGSGIGKSTFLGGLAGGIEADRVVIGLIGERSREVNEFVTRTLSPETLERTVVVAATASEPPGAKKRAAYCAMATAEHFRDEGRQVLLLFDSITRFAEAHRETALVAGETPALNAFPPSTVRTIAELAERAGPGTEAQGDITAVFSVLVAGSDMEEPVADMVRGILDGHIIMDRRIADRGRYPAIDVLRSVSRSLPRAASEDENTLIKEYRRTLSLYEEIAPMLRANLYERGHDPQGDRSIDLFPHLDGFVSLKNEHGIPIAFDLLKSLLESGNKPNEAG